jgi:hypothetical protein
VLGYFNTSEQAKSGEKMLIDAGFSNSSIVIQSYKDKGAGNTDHYVESLAHGQSLLVITVSGNVDEDKAIHILRESDAVKINEIETRFHPAEAAK